MKPMNLSMENTALRYLLIAFFMLGAMFAVSVSTASPAHACGKVLCDQGDVGGNNGAGNNPVPNPGGNTGGGGGGGGGGSWGGGGGGGGGTHHNIERIWNPAGPPVAFCPNDPARGMHIGYYTTMGYRYHSQPSRTPDPGSHWGYVGYFPDNLGIGGAYDTGGVHLWNRLELLNIECVYPPLKVRSTITCYISATVKIDRVVPNARETGRVTAGSAYREGSWDYNSCYNSRIKFNVQKGFDTYGYYNLSTSIRTATAVVETQVEPHPLTGAFDPPRIVGLSPAYSSGFRIVDNASLHCSAGFQKPGVMHSDWTDNPCINMSYVCPYVDPKIDVSDTGAAKSMRSFSGKLQLVRDGKNRELQFGLGNIRGTSITVNNHQTRFLRSGTPWDASKSYSKNLFELSTSPSSSNSLLSNSAGGATSMMSGKVNNVFTRGYFASEVGKPTTVTQEVTWSGTRQVRSGFITGVDPKTGQITGYGARYITVPTSGKCSQTATLEYVRAIGHEAGK